MALLAPVVAIAVLVVGLLAAYRSVRIVEEGRVEALLMFGEMQTVLHPGLNFVPPFVSNTYPIDPETMTMDASTGRVDIPPEFEDAIREAAKGTSGEAGATARTAETGGAPPGATSTRSRTATVVGWALFVLGAFGLAVPMFMLGHVLEYERWMVSWLFPEATLSQVVLAAALSLSAMVLGETVGHRCGTTGDEQGEE